MSNAAAAKIGLKDCRPEEGQVRCDGVQPNLPDLPHPHPAGSAPRFEGPNLYFDGRSKRLVRIDFFAFHWGTEDFRTPQLLTALSFPKCPQRWSENSVLAQTCYRSPDQVLSASVTPAKSFYRKSYPSHLLVRAQKNAPRVARFTEQRDAVERAQRKKNQADQFAKDLELGK